MTFIIPPTHEGRILRSYLKLTLGISTASLAKLKNHPQGITVNGNRVTVTYVLRAGDVLRLADTDTPETATQTVLPAKLPLDILYEDDRVIAMNKPPFMPTHPSHGHLTDTLANALAWRYHSTNQPFVFRPLGRLDRNTSGIVISGKSKPASGALGKALLAGKVRKRYIAILWGNLLPRICREISSFDENAPWEHPVTIKTYMYRPEGEGIRRRICPMDTLGAEIAVTRFSVLGVSQDKAMTLVIAEPITGRTHQLRLHFSHWGAPILGDDIYGESSTLIARHALHAAAISVPLPFYQSESSSEIRPLQEKPFQEPINGVDENGILHTYAPIPQDMAAVLAAHFPHISLLSILKMIHAKDVLNETN